MLMPSSLRNCYLKSFRRKTLKNQTGLVQDTPLLCFPGSDAQRLLRLDEEAPLKDQKIAVLE